MVPCALLALAVHPSTSHNIVNRVSWAFCVYLEAVSVLPQLRSMQNTKVLLYNLMSENLVTEFFMLNFLILFLNMPQIVEPFTAHYVFALGVARFLSCAHWVLQVCSIHIAFSVHDQRIYGT